MAKRIQRAGTKREPARKEPRPSAPLERHSGEGSASALETLQKLESNRRLQTRPADPSPEEDPSS